MTRFEKIYEAVSNKVSLGQITTEDFKNMMDIAFEKHVTESYDDGDEITEWYSDKEFKDKWDTMEKKFEEMEKRYEEALESYNKSSNKFMEMMNDKPDSDDDEEEFCNELFKLANEVAKTYAELEDIDEEFKILNELDLENMLVEESANPKATLNKIKAKVNITLKKCESLFKKIESKVTSTKVKAKFAKLKEKIKLAKINGMKKGKAFAEKLKASAKKASEKAKSTLKKESEDVEETKAAIFESLENDDIDVDTAMELLSMLND